MKSWSISQQIRFNVNDVGYIDGYRNWQYNNDNIYGPVSWSMEKVYVRTQNIQNNNSTRF